MSKKTIIIIGIGFFLLFFGIIIMLFTGREDSSFENGRDALPENIKNKERCEEEGFYWYENKCHYDPLPDIDAQEIRNEEECIERNFYWYDGMCHEEVGEDRDDDPSTIETREECAQKRFYWYDGMCHEDPQKEEDISLENIENEEECLENGFYWYNGMCYETPQQEEEGEEEDQQDNDISLENIENEEECLENGFYWYDGMCHDIPQESTEDEEDTQEEEEGEEELPFANGNPCEGLSTHTDHRNNLRYDIVQIGRYCWMAENLNYETDESWCYENQEENCDSYGRLYNYNDAVDVCPRGWRLPTDEEFREMERALGMSLTQANEIKWRGSNEGEKIKSEEWDGSDISNFSALPAGGREPSGEFNGIDIGTGFWTSTKKESSAFVRMLYSGYPEIKRIPLILESGLSVRCIKG